MATTDDSPPPAEPPQRRRGGLSGLLRQVLGAFGEEADPDAPEGAGELARHAHEFARLDVGDVMTPRADIQALELSAPFSEVVARFNDTEHSRLPIYRETLDDPVGVVHIKDIFRLLAGGTRKPKPEAAVLKRLKREVLYVPASMRAADLMSRMQASRLHMALVIDEYGGVSGLVTLEDVIEAVVGEIDDEHDEAQVSGVVVRSEGLFEADARADLEDLESVMGVSDLAPTDMEEEIDTVGGLVTALAGRVPRRGELIAHPFGWEFEVVDADPRRVKRVRVRRTPAVESDAA